MSAQVYLHPACATPKHFKVIQAQTMRMARIDGHRIELVEDPRFCRRLADKIIEREMQA